MHGVLEAHHIIEDRWLDHPAFTRLRKAFSTTDDMPAIALSQSDHRGNVSQIAGLVGEELPDLGKTDKKSITTVLLKGIVREGKVPDGVTPKLVVKATTTEEELLDALHKIYKEHDPDLYERVLKRSSCSTRRRRSRRSPLDVEMVRRRAAPRREPARQWAGYNAVTRRGDVAGASCTAASKWAVGRMVVGVSIQVPKPNRSTRPSFVATHRDSRHGSFIAVERSPVWGPRLWGL